MTQVKILFNLNYMVILLKMLKVLKVLQKVMLSEKIELNLPVKIIN